MIISAGEIGGDISQLPSAVDPDVFFVSESANSDKHQISFSKLQNVSSKASV